jgi:N-methylhydantoinase A
VMPVIREYERSVVTLINSYVAKIIQTYLRTLESKLKGKGLSAPFLVMQSTGGAISVLEAAEKPCHLFLSGPAGGVMGSLFLGEVLGHKNILTFDMGGTSTDVSAIMDGRPTMVNRSKLAEFDATLPKLDIHTIGAGGGSIGWIDHGVLLRVGPQSAGAEPGPACYNRGGKEPTVTDANVVLGYIDPDHFLDGRMSVHVGLAEEAIALLGSRLGLSLIETAMGIFEVANSNMVNAIRAVEKGHDPRDFVMMCFGGAGPLHAGALMKEMEIPIVIVPYTATVHSAFGFVCSNICHHLVKSHYIKTPRDPKPFNEMFSDLELRGRQLLDKEGVVDRDKLFKRYADLRYCGQVFEITVDLPGGTLDEEDIAAMQARFEETYDSLYGKGTGWKEVGIELINLRIDAIGQMQKPSLRKIPLPEGSAKVTEARKRPCYFPEAGGFVPTPFYDIEDLSPGIRVEGPAVIAMPSTSAVICPGQDACVDEYRNIIIRLKGGIDGQR